MEAKTRLVRQYTTQITANWQEITSDWQKLVPTPQSRRRIAVACPWSGPCTLNSSANGKSALHSGGGDPFNYYCFSPACGTALTSVSLSVSTRPSGLTS